MNKTLFGTDGIRRRVGIEPFTLQHLTTLGYAIGLWAHNKYGKLPYIALGNDTRHSCSFAKAALQSGLLLTKCHTLDAHIISTPALNKIIQLKQNIHCAIMISASHNYYHDNGIKIIDAQTGKISYEDEQEITDLYNNKPPISYTEFGSTSILTQAKKIYIEHLWSYFQAPFLKNKKIIIDCAQGALYSIAPIVFEKTGAEIITINNKPNGKNINDMCGALHPQKLQKAVTTHNADIGFAFDGDGDRVIAVNKYGEIKNGDDMLAILLHHSAYKNTKTIVGTSMTNCGFEKLLYKKNKELIRTSVGDKYIAQEIIKKNLILGGEPSGHIIVNDYMASGDGLFIALRILQTLVETNNWEMNSFEKFPQILTNVPVTAKKNLDAAPFNSIIAASKDQLQSGRLIVRYSGTEPLLRIMVEAANHHEAKTISLNLAKQLQQALS